MHAAMPCAGQLSDNPKQKLSLATDRFPPLALDRVRWYEREQNGESP